MAKVVAGTADDVATISVQASAKTTKLVVDDIATAPAMVTGFSSKREIPIIYKIAKGSIVNKLIIITPIILLLNAFLPQMFDPLLLIGGLYLAYEAVVKSKEFFSSPSSYRHAKCEKKAVIDAIKIDLILSFEILMIAFRELSTHPFMIQVAALVVISFLVTIIVYSLVLLIVRADEVGEWLKSKRYVSFIGVLILKSVPMLLNALTIVGIIFLASIGSHLCAECLHNMNIDFLHEIIEDAKMALGGSSFIVDTIINMPIGLVVGFVIFLQKKMILKAFT